MDNIRNRPNLILSDIKSPEQALNWIMILSESQLSDITAYSDQAMLECIAEITKYCLTKNF